jgi:hypothetical protein
VLQLLDNSALNPTKTGSITDRAEKAAGGQELASPISTRCAPRQLSLSCKKYSIRFLRISRNAWGTGELGSDEWMVAGTAPLSSVNLTLERFLHDHNQVGDACANVARYGDQPFAGSAGSHGYIGVPGAARLAREREQIHDCKLPGLANRAGRAT